MQKTSWKMSCLKHQIKYHREEILISVTVHGKSPLQLYEKGPHEMDLKFCLKKKVINKIRVFLRLP